MNGMQKGLLITASVAAIGGTAWILSHQADPLARLHLSPIAPRPWAVAAYEAAVHPVPSAKPSLDPAYLGEARLISKQETSKDPKRFHWEIDYSNRKPSETYVPPYEVIAFNSRDGFKTASGSGTVKWIASRTNTPEFRNGSDLKLLFMRPDGSPVPEAELIQKNCSAFTQHEVFITPFQMHLTLDGFENLQWQALGCFDPQTKRKLQSGHCTSPTSSKALFFSTDLNTVRDQPVVTVLDLFHGSVTSVEDDASDGTQLTGPHARVTILAMLSGEPNSWSYGSGGIRNLCMTDGPQETTRTHTTIYYRTDPPSMASAVTLGGLTVDGKFLNASDRGCSSDIRSCTIEAPLDQIQRLRADFRNQHCRLVITQDSLPGTPAMNQGLKDQFDLRFPMDAPAALMQRELPYLLTAEATPSCACTALPDAKRGETLREYLRRAKEANPKLSVEVDEKAYSIRIEERRPPAWLVKLKRLLHLP